MTADAFWNVLDSQFSAYHSGHLLLCFTLSEL